MMKTDYKFWYIKRDDNIHISEAAIRFYEGEVTTEGEDGEPVTRYRRVKRLKETDLGHLKSKKVKKESSGNDSIIFGQEDFGVISTDDELRLFLNKELAKDANREPIDQQK